MRWVRNSSLMEDVGGCLSGKEEDRFEVEVVERLAGRDQENTTTRFGLVCFLLSRRFTLAR